MSGFRPARHFERRALALIAVLCITAISAAQSTLQIQIEYALRTANLGDATVSISIHDADSGRVLADFDDDRPMIVASNMKLLTTGAALHMLGPDFRFRTQMVWDGSTLTIVGDGDPAFADPLLLEETSIGDQRGIDLDMLLDAWIAPLKAEGITHIETLVIDDRIFDREFVHPDWPIDQLNRRYCAEISGFNFNLNLMELFLRPQDNNRPLLVGRSPNFSWLPINNKATSRRRQGDQNTVWIARPTSTNNLTVFGNVRSPGNVAVSVPVTVHNPPELFARYLAGRLQHEHGISVDTFVVADVDDPRPEGSPVGPAITTPLTTALERCNRDSQNLFAEAILKRVGAEATHQPGSWLNGSAIVRHAVADRLRDPQAIEQVIVADGSGLSRRNRVKASTFTSWLDSFHQDPELGDVFIDSLAIGGQTGTLRKRFRSTDLYGATVQAKSGFINQVSCLSGFVTAEDGRRCSFSILINDLTAAGSVGRAKRFQEKVVGIIARDMAENPLVELGSDDR